MTLINAAQLTGQARQVTRFVEPPSGTESIEEEGYRWGFDNDGKGGWGKIFSGDPYGADHIEARRVLQKAAEMIGAKIEQGAQVG